MTEETLFNRLMKDRVKEDPGNFLFLFSCFLDIVLNIEGIYL
jgi:hypothetical protein